MVYMREWLSVETGKKHISQATFIPHESGGTTCAFYDVQGCVILVPKTKLIGNIKVTQPFTT